MAQSTRCAVVLMAVISCCAERTPCDPADGLIAHYPLDGDGTDAGPGGHHGSVYGAVPARDRFGRDGGALAFDGDDAVVVPDDPAFTLGSGDFTLAVWMKFAVVSSYYLMGHDEGPGTRRKWIFWVHDSGFFFHVNVPYYDVGWSGWTPAAGVWYHLAIRRRGQSFAFFVDGVLRGEAANPTGVPDPGASFQIGTAETDHPERVFRGAIDDVRWYGRALGDEEILALAAQTLRCGSHVSGSVGPGRDAEFTFWGAREDVVEIGVAGLDTSPAGFAASVELFAPETPSRPIAAAIGDPTAILSIRLPITGVYAIRVGSAREDLSGSYALGLWWASPLDEQCGIDLVPDEPVTGIVGDIETRQYRFPGRAGDAVVLAGATLDPGAGDEFRARVQVRWRDAGSLLLDRVGDPSFAAPIILPRDGLYTVSVSDEDRQGRGRYELTLHHDDPPYLGTCFLRVEDAAPSSTPPAVVRVLLALPSDAAASWIAGAQVSLRYDPGVIEPGDPEAGADVPSGTPLVVRRSAPGAAAGSGPGALGAISIRLVGTSPGFLSAGIREIIRVPLHAPTAARAGQCSRIAFANDPDDTDFRNVLIDSSGAARPLTSLYDSVACAPPRESASFVRGDADGNGSVEITDAIFLWGCLFGGGACPPCLKAADANGDAPDADDGLESPGLDLGDVVAILRYLFSGGPPPPAPFPACGLEVPDGPLPCPSFSGCASPGI